MASTLKTLWKITEKSVLCRYTSRVSWMRHPSPLCLSRFLVPTLITVKRNQSDSSARPTTDAEKRLVNKLQKTFPKATEIHVHDISGGCGDMYEVHILSEEFRGVRTVMQHRMVNEALKDEIKNMHGLRISTAEPEA